MTFRHDEARRTRSPAPAAGRSGNGEEKRKEGALRLRPEPKRGRRRVLQAADGRRTKKKKGGKGRAMSLPVAEKGGPLCINLSSQGQIRKGRGEKKRGETLLSFPPPPPKGEGKEGETPGFERAFGGEEDSAWKEGEGGRGKEGGSRRIAYALFSKRPEEK